MERKALATMFGILLIGIFCLNFVYAGSSSTTWVNFTMDLNGSDDSLVKVDDLRAEDKSTDWIYWTWGNPDDSRFEYAIVYLDGVNVANTTDEFYNATGLEAGELYIISIRAHYGSHGTTGKVSNSERTLSGRADDDSDDDDDDGSEEEPIIYFMDDNGFVNGGLNATIYLSEYIPAESKKCSFLEIFLFWLLVGILILIILVVLALRSIYNQH